MKYKYITSIGVIGIVLFTSIISIIIPDKEVSELEGRELQQLPTPGKTINEEFNTNAYIYELLTGSMFEKWDNYFSDHIYGRDNIVNIFTDLQSTLDKKYINGAYLGEDKYVFSKSNVLGVSDSKFIQSANHFNNFAKKFANSKTYLVNLPTKEMIYESNLPIDNYESVLNKYIDEVISNIDSNQIEVLDFRNSITNEEELFYKTDHHWNMNGTYKGYSYIINSLNKEYENIGSPKSKDEFSIKTYKDYFIGSDGRKVGQLVDETEDIEIYYNENFENLNVYNQDGEFDLFHYQYLNEEKFNNDYMVYLGGDNQYIKVENTKSNNDLKIVMIGDSMDNPLVPLLGMHFKEVHSFDLRHYNEDIINSIEDINPDIIMFIGLSTNIIDGNESGIFKWNLE